MSADTSYYISTRKYAGFIFPKDYEPMFEVGEGRYTPTFSQVNRAEIILLKKGKKYGSAYKRQYIGSITPSGDTLMNLRLLKNGFREECFDRIVAFGFHGRYEKNQSVKTVNLSTGKIEK